MNVSRETETKKAKPVEVPEEFRAIGYSGLFHRTLPVENSTHEEIVAMASRAPFLSPTRGWMILSVDVKDRTALAVRRDASAFIEAVTSR
jgi:hypothetical protein